MTEKANTLTFEKTTERVTFTTHRKKPKTSIDISKKGSVVKERCKQLTEIISNLFPSRVLSDYDLACLIQDYIGADKETVRSYKGYSGHVRAGRCGDNRLVGLSRTGYLEAFGFLKKVPGHRWMICQAVLSSQASDCVSSGFGSKEKISISQLSDVCNGNESSLVRNVASSNELEEEEATEKDRNFTPKISPMISEDADPNLAYLRVLAEAGRKEAEKV